MHGDYRRSLPLSTLSLSPPSLSLSHPLSFSLLFLLLSFSIESSIYVFLSETDFFRWIKNVVQVTWSLPKHSDPLLPSKWRFSAPPYSYDKYLSILRYERTSIHQSDISRWNAGGTERLRFVTTRVIPFCTRERAGESGKIEVTRKLFVEAMHVFDVARAIAIVFPRCHVSKERK